MSKLLLLDDKQQYLADTVSELKLAGCDVLYSDKIDQALELNRTQQPAMVIIALNNALAYPSFRKLKAALPESCKIIVYSDSDKSNIREWAYKQDVSEFFTHPFEQNELVNYSKNTLLRKNIHFNHRQLLSLTKALAKYSDSAVKLVQQHAPNSKSIQELQHKLARSLTNFEDQKNFLKEVQPANQSSIAS